MVKKLRIRFVVLAMLALIVLQVLIVFFSSYRSYSKILENADEIISEIYSAYPTAAETDARYFVVSFEGERISNIDLSHIITVKRKGADAYGRTVFQSKSDAGFVNDFRYHAYRENNKTVIIFIARGGNLNAFWGNTRSLIFVSLIGLAAMLVLLIIASKYVVRPIAENNQKQMEFITAASHELKTPLTVIKADIDILQMEEIDNEWIRDIREQTVKLSELTNSLVTLSRLEELNIPVKRIEFPISDLAEDVARSWQALAITDGKQLITHITHDLSYFGDENLIRQLFTILLDNAFKYSVPKSGVEFSLEKSGGGIAVSVSNTVEQLNENDFSRFFDRFYRAERTSEKKGFGLGLSIARQIVKFHNGKISAKGDGQDRIILIAILK